jgi:hypothetical protein
MPAQVPFWLPRSGQSISLCSDLSTAYVEIVLFFTKSGEGRKLQARPAKTDGCRQESEEARIAPTNGPADLMLAFAA